MDAADIDGKKRVARRHEFPFQIAAEKMTFAVARDDISVRRENQHRIRQAAVLFERERPGRNRHAEMLRHAAEAGDEIIRKRHGRFLQMMKIAANRPELRQQNPIGGFRGALDERKTVLRIARSIAGGRVHLQHCDTHGVTSFSSVVSDVIIA